MEGEVVDTRLVAQFIYVVIYVHSTLVNIEKSYFVLSATRLSIMALVQPDMGHEEVDIAKKWTDCDN